MFQIINFCFWAFIIAQVVLILAHQHIKFRFTQTGLVVALCLKILLLAAYCGWLSVCAFPAESDPSIKFFLANSLMRFLAFVFELMLVGIVFITLLPHTINKNATYALKKLSAQKVGHQVYRIFGTLHEGRFDFNVVGYISEEYYLSLVTAGYFDKAGSYKTLNARFKSYVTQNDFSYPPVDAEVEIF